MLLSCGTAMASLSGMGPDADSSCCWSRGLFLASSMGNHLLGSQCQGNLDVLQQDNVSIVGPCLPWLAFYCRSGCLLPLEHQEVCSWPSRRTEAGSGAGL